MTGNPYDAIDDEKGYGSNADKIRRYAWNEGYNQAIEDVLKLPYGREASKILKLKKVSE